ncbi:integral membrane [Fusarium longipes]|uniref:Integral membrane n=1 Tax=Fusarium longipes TaxID=694270 RepID=A0A395T601_9HYPO|nr:integral membrane [Fusarium longipes]
MGWVLNATPEVDRSSEYPKIIGITVALTVLAVSIVSARLYIRWKARGMAGDDWMSALSMLFALIYSGICIAQTRYGLGLPIPDRPKENLVPYTRINFAGRPFYQLGISFFKIALLISYLRLLRGTDNKVYRRVIWLTALLVFLSHLGCTLALVFACNPVDKSWNPLKDGQCLPPGPSFTGYAVVTIVSDVVVAVLPIPVLVKLEIKLAKKIGLIAIFTLGIFTTVCSIQRYRQIDRIQNPKDGNSTMLVLWGTIEFNVGNIVSSLPFLAPIFIKRARQYRSKPSSHNTPSRSKGLRSNGYKLKDLSYTGKREQSIFTTAENDSGAGSQENILNPHGGIVKSVTYTVEVDKVDKSTSDSADSRDMHP